MKDSPNIKKSFNWNIYSITGGILTIIGVLFWINVGFLSTGIATENEVPSLVIFPFVNKGEAKDEFYSYGISSDLIQAYEECEEE